MMNRAELDELEFDIDCEITSIRNNPNPPAYYRDTIDVLTRSLSAIKELRTQVVAAKREVEDFADRVDDFYDDSNR